MSEVRDLAEENKQLSDLGGQSLEHMEKGNYPVSSGLEPANISIAWLNERIAELEVMNAMLRSMRAQGDAS